MNVRLQTFFHAVRRDIGDTVRMVTMGIPLPILVFCWCMNGTINHAARTYAQDHPWAYEAIGVMDGVAFLSGGGGSVYANQFTWTMARSLKEPRPVWHMLLFWDIGPSMLVPDEYPYRPNFEHEVPPRFDKS